MARSTTAEGGDHEGRRDVLTRLEGLGVVRAVLLIGGLVGALTGIGAGMVWGVQAFRGAVDPPDPPDPHAADYAALRSLDLDVRLEYFESSFGTARSVEDFCAATTCDAEPDEEIRIYTHETEAMVVRAVFEGNSLQMYTVTTMAEGFAPPVSWLGMSLGRLGEFTAAQAFARMENVEPTDAVVFVGNRARSYADVVSIGAPARYRGLVLAWAPEGLAGPPLTFDESALEIATSGGPAAMPELMEQFRAGTTPNTYGEFRDDGFVARQVREADRVTGVLFTGSEL